MILGVLMAVVAVNLLGQGERAKKRATEASMNTIQSQLGVYQLEYSAYPPQLVVLQQLKFLDESKPVKDAWKRDYYYALPGSEGRPYDLISAGNDGEFGTIDDVNVWTIHGETGQ